jgi:predicted Co/Zn/Cd cation transporter (cation efflux family)
VGPSFKIFSLLVLGVVCLLMAVYSLVGVLQAGMLFDGERAMRNFQVWGPATLIFVVCAAGCFLWAWRLVRRQRAAVAQYLAARRSYARPTSSTATPSEPDEQ